jgi:hypothetical protein
MSLLKVNTVQTDTLKSIAGVNRNSVLQVVQANSSTQVAITSLTLQPSGLSGTITPTSATSKILVLVDQVMYVIKNTDAGLGAGFSLFRGDTEIHKTRQNASGPSEFSINLGISLLMRQSIIYLDSPGTTNEITYSTKGAVNSTANDHTLFFQLAGTVNPTSYITLMEIAQ